MDFSAPTPRKTSEDIKSYLLLTGSCTSLAEGTVPNVISLEDPKCSDTTLSGGKGASLALMIQGEGIEKSGEVRIPRGICVTTAAFEEHLKKTVGLSEGLKEIEEVANKKEFATIDERRQLLEETCDR